MDGSIVARNGFCRHLFAGGNRLALIGAFIGEERQDLLVAAAAHQIKNPGILAGILVMMASYSINLRIMGKRRISH